jgi:hypothetical protein
MKTKGCRKFYERKRELKMYFPGKKRGARAA